VRVRRESNGQVLDLGSASALGVGGEARIQAVPQAPQLVAKLYRQPTIERAQKLQVMLANPPEDPMAAQGHCSIAWPVDRLLSLDGTWRVVGFLMPRVGDVRPVIDFYNPKSRRQTCPLFNYLYLHRAARNVAAGVRALHVRGYVIGDVNESNILVAETALATLVDTDSFQVATEGGQLYRCPVGKPEFTPPELQGKVFSRVDRTLESDLFGLGVLLFQLLLEGTHPFSGVYQGRGDPPPLEARISAAHFPFASRGRVPYAPMPVAPPFEVPAPALQALFRQCFEDGHASPQARSDAQTWLNALNEAENALTTCAANEQHRYGNHLAACPWCERAARFGRDPFPSRQAVERGEHLQAGAPAQRPLPPAGQGVRPAPRTRQPAQPQRVAQPANPLAWLAAALALFACAPAARLYAAPAALLLGVLGWRGARRVGGRGLWLARGSVALSTAMTAVALVGLGRAKLPLSRGSGGPSPSRVALSLPANPQRGATFTNSNDAAAMLYIPPGEFTMGSREGEAPAEPNEKPQRKVNLDGYWIYKREVTVAQYRKFCQATGRDMPEAPSWGWKDDHPIVNVSWDDATAYAKWAGVALPTEAQWEKAARGTDGRGYPWGNEWDNSKCANSEGNMDLNSSTKPVGSYASGISPYGVHDMAGNVWEWCSDWYGSSYYANAPKDNPTGPASGEYRVLRGGSWIINDPTRFRCAGRDRYGPGDRDVYSGFRCALSRPDSG